MKNSMVRAIKHLVRANDCFLGDHAPSSENLDDNPQARPTRLFYGCIALYCFYMLAMQPQWMLAGEMWAEMATNYFVNANAPSVLTRLFATDAGYVPLLQRLIATAGRLLQLPSATIPYFYTWTSVCLTGALVASFCLSPFRVLVRSDWLRFFVAASVLLVADFETRTFINFTYFVAFFVAITSALAMANRSVPVPPWAWCIPLLMVSKPAVIATLPAMLLISFVSESRFRKIAYASLLACLFQIVVLAFHQVPAPAATAIHFGIIERLAAGIAYFIGFTGSLFFGKGPNFSLGMSLLSGLVVLGICGVICWRKRTPSNALILVGIFLLFFNFMLNAVAMPGLWNLDMRQLAGVPLYRHTIVGYFGVICIAVVLTQVCTKRFENARVPVIGWLAPVVFSCWFTLSGWLLFAAHINRAPGVPTIFNSQWQLMSEVIDAGLPVCVPVDPIGWVYERECRLLNTDVHWGQNYEFTSLESLNGKRTISLVIPDEAMQGTLMSFAILVKPTAVHAVSLTSSANITMKDGSMRFLLAQRKIPAFGGLLLYASHEKILIKDIQDFSLNFEVPVDVGYLREGVKSRPAAFWMGN